MSRRLGVSLGNLKGKSRVSGWRELDIGIVLTDNRQK